MYHSRLRFTNGLTSVALDAVSGAVLELVREATQDNFVKNHRAAEETPFRLTLHTPAGQAEARPARSAEIALNEALRPEIAVRQGEGEASATVRYPFVMVNDAPTPIAARVTMRLAAGDERLEMTLTLDNGAPDAEIETVLFPYLTGVWLGETWRDDTLYLPLHAGQRVENPVETLAAAPCTLHWKWQEYDYVYAMNGPTGTPDAHGAHVVELPYSGGCTMLWLDLFDETEGAGLYLTCRNAAARMKTLRAEAFGTSSPGLGVGIGHYAFTKEGGVWKSDPCVVAPHGGSWRWAADDYRAWRESAPVVDADGAEAAIPLGEDGTGPLHPAWMDKSAGLMAHYDFQYQSGGIVHTYKDIPRLFEEAQRMGMNHLLLSGWHESGFDYGFPQYRINPNLGTEAELRGACRAVRAAGGHIGFYVNSRLCNTIFPDRTALWQAGTVRTREGEPMLERYGAERLTFAPMCSQAEIWQQELLRVFRWLTRDIGADTLYLDQLAMAASRVCFSHGHDDHPDEPAGWNAGVRRLLRRLAEEAPEGGVALLFEGANDVYGRAVSGQLISTMFYEHSGAFPQLYRYTFPKQSLIDMMNPRRHSAMRPEHVARRACKLLYRAFVTGMYLWVYDLVEDNAHEDDDAQTRRVRDCVTLRRAWLERYGRGVFRDETGVADTPAGSLAARYRLADGSLLVACAQEGGLSGSVTVSLDAAGEKPIYTTPRVSALTPDAPDAEAPLFFSVSRRADGGRELTFHLPDAELAVVVIRP